MSYLVHFDLVEDLRRAGCPLCRAAERTSREYLRTLMAADIMDGRVRNQLRHAEGLCGAHVLAATDVAAAAADSLGLALLEELLLEIGREVLASRVPKRRPWRRRRRRCPACDAEAVTVAGYADLLAADPARYVPLCHAGGPTAVCLPHAILVAARTGTPTKQRGLTALWTAGLDQLQHSVDAAIGAHRADGPVSREAATSPVVWRDVPAWLSGSRGRLPRE